MRIVLQRVSEAEVTVDGVSVGRIGPGFLVLLGIHPTDSTAVTIKMAEKVCGLRVFPDDDGKMNRSITEAGGSLLVVSQFTLYGDCRKGRRPSFVDAARPETAEPLYVEFVRQCRCLGVPVETGVFGADMQIRLVNSGPVTLLLDSAD